MGTPSTLPTIPEATPMAATETSSRLVQHSFVRFPSPKRRNHHRCGREQQHPALHLRPKHLQLCLLVLAPVYILLLSSTLLHPSFRLIFLGSHPQRRHHLDGEQLRKAPAESKDADQKTTLRQPVGAGQRNEAKSRMSVERVVTISFDGDQIRTVVANTTGTTEAKTERLGLHPNDYYLANQTLLSIAPLHVSESDIVAHDPMNRTDCVPMAWWQATSFPTCNSIHEMNVFSSSSVLFRFDPSRNGNHSLRSRRVADGGGIDGKGLPISDPCSARLLGHGWFRHVWKVTDSSGAGMAIKTLRPGRDFSYEYHELHRRDAVAMERLTSSPYVMDIFGHCGQSALTELAFSEGGINHLYRLSVRLKGINTPFALRSKLQIAAMTSLGLAHIHSVDVDDGSGIPTNGATIAHYDMNPRNVIISQSGKPKINDFNVAEFLTRHPETKMPCGFESRLHEPWWRAPEEMITYNSSAGGVLEVSPGNMISEKADVYSLGNTLYVLLTGLEPRGKEHKRQRYKNVSNLVASGDHPDFPQEYANATNPGIVAIRHAIRLCWEPDPHNRPAAMDIAKYLYAVLHELKKNATTDED